MRKTAKVFTGEHIYKEGELTMKKQISLALAGAMALSLAACGGSMKVFLQLLKEEKSDEA